jgi:4-hydroxy-3-polyprenylbenzoate decarboxylase
VTQTTHPRRLVIGLSGASGVVFGVRALELLAPTDVEVHLVVSKSAEVTMGYELDRKPREVRDLADRAHSPADIGASIASGSFRTMGMLILPCSIRTMSEIATGVTSTLLTRAADVVLKERRRLVLALRETPLHTGHLRTMTALSEMGAVVAPLSPGMYAKPESLDDLIDHTVGRLLDLFDIETGVVHRWRDHSET